MTLKVSVVMGVFNNRQTVERAVRSVLEQDVPELEVVAVDDGSTDGSGELLDALATADARLRVIHTENAGLTAALVRGCREARGVWIARQDADDRSLPGRLRRQAQRVENDTRLGFVSCGTRYVGPRGELLLEVVRSDDPEVATRGLLEARQGPPAHGSVMFRRELYEAVGGYRLEFRFAQDSDLWLRMGERAMTTCVPEILYEHRKDLDSTSGAGRDWQRRLGDLGHACRAARLCGEPEAPWLAQAAEVSASAAAGNPRQSRRARAAAAYLLGSQLARNRDPRARAYFLTALAERPWHLRAWYKLAASLGLPAAGAADEQSE